ncbi:hypothetical protein PIB30_088814 [Stylosanthes scabra]|uniref:Transposase, Ptta/En/Spm, plant n=1 Tax=Stylosanthes scabra TaxID=79078 RepID=A0ABU6RV65_9FABA|nr:hypothetical protein [Stylosanthes scabra]
MTRGDRGRGRGDRGRGTGRRGRPKKRTGIPLDLGEPAAGTSAPTPVPVVPTPSPAKGGPTIRMIPTPESSRVHSSSDTTGTRSQRQSPTQTSGDHDDDGPPPGAPDPMPWPPVDSTLQEGGGGHRLGGGAHQAGWSYLPPLGRCWNKVRKGTTKISWVFYNYYREFVPQFSMASDEMVRFWWDRWRRQRATKRLRDLFHEIRSKGAPHPWIRDDLWDQLVEFWRQEDFKKLKEVNKQNRASSTGGSLHTGGSTTYEATRDRMEAFLAELKRLQAERQALMEAVCPEPPPIDEAALWTRFAGGRKRGRIYGMGVVPSHQHPPLFSDDEDADTASAPDLRERVVMLNREISQQAEANARRITALESTVQTQSQEVSDLRKAYADMYSLLTQMRSGGSSSAPLPDFPPPPPPPPPPQTDAPGTGPGTGSLDADDDPDYV